MRIEWIKLKGFRNFEDARINFRGKTLVIGANDVGKTNLFYAIRLLLDRTLSEADIEPAETDFHIQLDGDQVEDLEILIKLSGITEDAVLSRLKGWVTDVGETYLKYEADGLDLCYKLYIGYAEDALDEIDSRSYLKHIHLQYIQSSRDLTYFIRSEKRQLIRLSKKAREDSTTEADQKKEEKIQTTLSNVNRDIGKLSYVAGATKSVNKELKKLSHHHSDYVVGLEAKAVNFSTFIDQLSLGATTCDRSVGLGGDGRNNQILVALWKAKSECEHDLENEAVIYCVEEPEAHLHPHQQRKLAKYLIEELPGQVFISTHSSQITQAFRPNGIVRLFEKEGKSFAANDGCSDCVEIAWNNMGYRMSILPAEAFFADAVFLVEGPSELLFYQELARQLGIDLDLFNISILSVDGIDFKVFVKILNAMEIPWVMRTDNDVFKVPRSTPSKWRLAGLNRALEIAGEQTYRHMEKYWTPQNITKWWKQQDDCLSPKGIYIANVDLENDLGEACEDSLKSFAGTDNLKEAIEYLQEKKALRMGEFLSDYKACLKELKNDALATPLHHAVRLVEERRIVMVGE